MWIFTINYLPSGSGESSDLIYRVNAGDQNGDLALRKLHKALIKDRIIPSKLTEQEFMDAFDETYRAYPTNSVEIRSVHPSDDKWVG
jgi:hypothetical protein